MPEQPAATRTSRQESDRSLIHNNTLADERDDQPFGFKIWRRFGLFRDLELRRLASASVDVKFHANNAGGQPPSALKA